MGLKYQVFPVSSYPLKNLASTFQMAGVLHMRHDGVVGLSGVGWLQVYWVIVVVGVRCVCCGSISVCFLWWVVVLSACCPFTFSDLSPGLVGGSVCVAYPRILFCGVCVCVCGVTCQAAPGAYGVGCFGLVSWGFMCFRSVFGVAV